MTDPLLRELVVETPWNLGVLEHAIARARLADLSDDEIRKLIAQGGPQMVHAYIAVTETQMLYDCWCGDQHWVTPLGGDETWRNLWHFLAAELRIPQLAGWLDRLSRRG